MLLETNKLVLVPRRSLAAVLASCCSACLLAIASVFSPLAWKRNTAPTPRTQYPPRPDGSKRTRTPGEILLEIVGMMQAGKKGS